MQVKEIISVLKFHNEWKKGIHSKMLSPALIGNALDKAIELLEVLKNKEVYAFRYDDTENDYYGHGTSSIISYHFTKKDAYKAMKKYINQEYEHWLYERNTYGKDKFVPHFGKHERWKIQTIKID